MRNTLKHSERQEMEALIKWASLYNEVYPYLLHIPNGGKRNLLEALALKKQGVKKGVSDLFLAYPTRQYAGLWLEMKVPGGRVSPSQWEWIKLMRRVNYRAEVAYGWEQGRNIIMEYLMLSREKVTNDC